MINFNSLNTQLYKQKINGELTNETIDTTHFLNLKKYNFVLDADYWKVTVLNVFVFLIVGEAWSIVVFNRAYRFFWFQRLIFFLFLFCYYRELVLIKKDLHLGLTMFFLSMDFSDKYNRNSL
jgi:hypothetical protein